jgi:hypothetical protein
MLSVGLWRWYINITITILDIIQRHVFYLKHEVAETEFCLRIQLDPTQVGPIERASRFHLKTEKESSPRKVIF